MIALVADVDRVCKNIQESNRNSATQSFCPSSEKRKSVAFLDFHFFNELIEWIQLSRLRLRRRSFAQTSSMQRNRLS